MEGSMYRGQNKFLPMGGGRCGRTAAAHVIPGSGAGGSDDVSHSGRSGSTTFVGFGPIGKGINLASGGTRMRTAIRGLLAATGALVLLAGLTPAALAGN